MGAGIVGAVAEAVTEALTELLQARGGLFEQRAERPQRVGSRKEATPVESFCYRYHISWQIHRI